MPSFKNKVLERVKRILSPLKERDGPIFKQFFFRVDNCNNNFMLSSPLNMVIICGGFG
jgi:hypothetical protein